MFRRCYSTKFTNEASTMISRLRSRSMQQVHFAPICVCLRCRQRLIPSDCRVSWRILQSLSAKAKVSLSKCNMPGAIRVFLIETQMAKAIRTALKDNDGSLLAFLPGVAEIERTAEALGTLAPDVELQRLHGAIDGDAQRAALAPPPQGMRKVILSTSIAETSVTLDDVRIVVDSGLARRPRYDRDAGLTRLVTERASRSSVTQRSGRAARQASGIAIRLWDEASNASLLPHDPPEILEADLSSLLLSSILWGERDARRLPFFDSPPSAALDEACRRLLGILEQSMRMDV